jgi:hypothetical protein
MEYSQEEEVKPFDQFTVRPERAPAILKPSQWECCLDAYLSEVSLAGRSSPVEKLIWF